MKNISNKKFYQDAFIEFGVSAQGVHWQNKYTQYKRFEVITKLLKKDISSSTIVDAGCGFGEYYQYLSVNNKIPVSYAGIDIEKRMIKISKNRFPALDFYQKNILYEDCPNADYYISSGAMNIMKIDQIEIFITKCFENSNKGFVFNFLKNITFNDVKQDEVIDICSSKTNNLKIKENYLDNDFTIFMVK
ncbi:MAG: class I SAM-dependent methyltransferase [Campylobacterota bacterium]|nr:class I SAM-dependent methyltransferase [Campylobacterota bacterium]